MDVRNDTGALDGLAVDGALEIDNTKVFGTAKFGADGIRAHRGMTIADLDADVAGGVALFGDCLAELAIEPYSMTFCLSFEGDLHVVQHFVFRVNLAETLRGKL